MSLQPKFKPGRMYNIAFPLMLVPPLIGLVAIIFVFPYDVAFRVLPMMTKQSLEQVHRVTGSTSQFGLRSLGKPGFLSTLNK